jgi:transposase
LNSESLVEFTEDEKKERICGVLEQTRAESRQADSARLEARKRAHELGIDLIFIPPGSPHLNPIEQVWDYLKWTMAPIVVENENEFKTFVQETFKKITQRISFAKK